MYYLGRCSSELTELVLHPHSYGMSSHYSNRLRDFPVTILKCYKDVFVNSFLLCNAKLKNCVPTEYFPLTYDLTGYYLTSSLGYL